MRRICAAVAPMRDGDFIVLHDARGHGRPHAFVTGFLRLGDHGMVCRFHRASKQIDVGNGWRERCHGIDRHLARDIACGVAAHAVGNDE